MMPISNHETRGSTIMPRPFILALAVLTLALCLGGCGDETVYDWQRPHDSYLVGSFSQSQGAEALKSKLQKNGYATRIETELKNGEFYLNVLVDVYDATPDTLSRLEAVAGTKPIPRKSTKSGAVSKGI
jgi:hypothetical protein